VSKFGEILESADKLSVDEKESLVSILNHRVAEQRRDQVVEAVKQARREFKEGRCRPATTAQIMKKLLA
jgi:hypothetical protein